MKQEKRAIKKQYPVRVLCVKAFLPIENRLAIKTTYQLNENTTVLLKSEKIMQLGVFRGMPAAGFT